VVTCTRGLEMALGSLGEKGSKMLYIVLGLTKVGGGLMLGNFGEKASKMLHFVLGLTKVGGGLVWFR
jgi:hypothetical protein